MAVNTWDGSSSTDWGTAANWTTTGVTDRVQTADDDVVIPDCSSINNCILDGDTTINSLEVQGNGNFSMNNHDLTVDGENGSGRALDIGNNTVTFVGGTGTLIFTLSTGTTDLMGITHLSGSTELRNLQFNGGATFKLTGNTTVTGNLTITAGTLDTDSSNNYDLTVTGTTTLSGTLNLNGSTASFNSGATEGGVILEAAGYINGDADSTVTIGSISATGTSNRGVSLAGTNTINKYKASDNLIINLMDGTVDGTTLFTVTTPDAKGIALQENTCSLTLNPS